MPQRGLAHRLRQHPVADGDDEAAVLGHRDEARRRHLAQLGVAPAQQRLGADDAAVGQVDLRLVVQPEAVAHQRLAHGVVQPHVLAAVDLGARLVQAEVGAAGGLDGAHRGVGVAQPARRCRAPCDGASATPMLQVSVNGAPSMLQGCATTFSTRRAVASAAARVGPVQQQRELVAAEARQQVVLAQAALDALGHVEQHAVADRRGPGCR